uniref:G-protein coupled receptors family 1 profile domain-containing protein n=1 Tax=Poecilia latipinna TaxID=48699 RepID=A0A3B3TWS9_9TELE
MCSLGGSAFMLLTAMAFDRYVAICRPMRYAALVSPRTVKAVLLFCWLLPATMVLIIVLLAVCQPLCRSNINRLYCDVYSLNRLSCGGNAAQMSDVFAIFISIATVLLPVIFVLFSYSSILYVSLCRTRGSSSKALRTCLPHLLVFLNYRKHRIIYSQQSPYSL